MLWGNDSLNNIGEVVDMTLSANAQKDIVKGAFLDRSSLIGTLNDLRFVSESRQKIVANLYLPSRGLQRSLPRNSDLLHSVSFKLIVTTMSSLLKGNAILSYAFEPRPPNQSHIAGVCGLQPPREKGRDAIAADYREGRVSDDNDGPSEALRLFQVA